MQAEHRIPNSGFRYVSAGSQPSTVAAVRYSRLVLPNKSLNRTHCGVPPFGLKNPSPNAVTPQRSG